MKLNGVMSRLNIKRARMGGCLGVRKVARREEQRPRTADWKVALIIAGGISANPRRVALVEKEGNFKYTMWCNIPIKFECAGGGEEDLDEPIVLSNQPMFLDRETAGCRNLLTAIL